MEDVTEKANIRPTIKTCILSLSYRPECVLNILRDTDARMYIEEQKSMVKGKVEIVRYSKSTFQQL